MLESDKIQKEQEEERKRLKGLIAELFDAHIHGYSFRDWDKQNNI